VIHSDFEKGFIKAEIFNYKELIAHGTESAVRAAGRLRIEGKEYIMQEGDIAHFRFN
jgi:ribosome-binding ATPase YchF (GTP1/OBG family)